MTSDLQTRINNQHKIVGRETRKLDELLACQRMQNELGCDVLMICHNPCIPGEGAMIGCIDSGVQGRSPVMAHQLDHLQQVIALTRNHTLSWRCFGWRDEPAPSPAGDPA